MVGQQYIRLLENHPWFRVVYVAASPQSVGMQYSNALKNGWIVGGEIPKGISKLIMHDVADTKSAAEACTFVFSAFEMSDKNLMREYENKYAAAGLPVFSNTSVHRENPLVPMIIGEINPHHLKIISQQKKQNGWNGFVVVKPNCSLQSYLTPIYALQRAGFPVVKIILTTMQAVSGAGYPGVASLDMIDNIVPFIFGEEVKTESEPLKILGDIKAGRLVPHKGMKISAHCNRVPVSHGHLACVSIEFGRKKPTKEKIIEIWRKFRGEPQVLNLPLAPKEPIVYRDEPDRPQPSKDRDNDKAMAVTVGRLREDNVFDFKFVALSHNTVRGAAGGGILNAELAYKKGYLKV